MIFLIRDKITNTVLQINELGKNTRMSIVPHNFSIIVKEVIFREKLSGGN